jgi:hypothetical protein
MPSGIPSDPTGDRDEWTFGFNFYVTPQLVLKADYQVRDDASSGGGVNNQLNLGIGWEFN